MPFRGLIYSEVGFPNCIYINGTMLSQSSYQLKVFHICKVYKMFGFLQIPLMGCETKINGDGNFENAIIIQENSAFVQSTDKKYLLTCIPSTPIAPTAPPNLFGMDARLSLVVKFTIELFFLIFTLSGRKITGLPMKVFACSVL